MYSVSFGAPIIGRVFGKVLSQCRHFVASGRSFNSMDTSSDFPFFMIYLAVFSVSRWTGVPARRGGHLAGALHVPDECDPRESPTPPTLAPLSNVGPVCEARGGASSSPRGNSRAAQNDQFGFFFPRPFPVDTTSGTN